MKMSRHVFVVLSALAVTMIWSGSVSAGPWGVPSGTADNFSYANGGDLNGRFGDPFIFGDTFYFVASNFQLNAVNGEYKTQSDTVSVDVTANSGLFFSTMHVTAYGSYAVTGAGSRADLDATLAMQEIGGLGRTWTGPLVTAPLFPIYSGTGTWTGQAVVDVSIEFPTPEPSIHVSLENFLEVLAGATGASEFNVQYEDLVITFDVIPEPATLALLALGGLALIRRRRG